MLSRSTRLCKELVMHPQASSHHESAAEQEFGTFLKTLRVNKHIKQAMIVALLKPHGWTQSSYSRLESSEIPPRFDDLHTLYRAFQFSGIAFSSATRQQFLDLARKRMERKRTSQSKRSDPEWAQLRFELARLDSIAEPATRSITSSTSART